MAESATVPENLADFSPDYIFHPFGQRLSSLITESLTQNNKDKYRQGTKLVPTFVVWLVLAFTIRRDLSCPAVLNWMISGWRWVSCSWPKQLVTEGAITQARVRLGVEVFRSLFNRLVASFAPLRRDFHGWSSVIFDGSTGTMPDTDKNRQQFGKAKSRRQGESSAYPQLRWVSLLALSSRLVLDVAYGPSIGKGTGERTLMMQLLNQLHRPNLLYLVDAGLYSFLMMFTIEEQDCMFLLKVSSHPKLPVLKRFKDGSYLSQMCGKVLDLAASTTKRNAWRSETLSVRVIPYQIPGFRPCRLVTNILDLSITAKELVIHYHRRWDTELCFDEIKTHQCATLRGQMPTLFRSKRPDLVEQELYAMLTVYNVLRELMIQAATQLKKDPLLLSFLDCLQLVIDAVPNISNTLDTQVLKTKYQYLLDLLAQADIDRPRRNRVNDRVVKVKMSKFKRKTSKHKSKIRNIEQELQIGDLKAA
jgi:hypothetical protein